MVRDGYTRGIYGPLGSHWQLKGETMFYSKSTGGFYDPAIHTAIPADAVEITESYHADLLAAQSAGKRIEPDVNGYPIAVDPPPPTDAELATAIRAERDTRITSSDWTQLPDVPLTAAQKSDWAAYRQALRDVTAQPTFPQSVTWPVPPA